MSWCSWLLLWLVTVMAGVAAIAGTVADCRRMLRRRGFVRLLCRDFTVECWALGAVNVGHSVVDFIVAEVAKIKLSSRSGVRRWNW